MTSLRLKPFQAVHPPASDAPRIASVPYDVISRIEASLIAANNKDSFIHVVRSEVDLSDDISPYDDQVYIKANENYRRLREQGVLVKDTKQSLYLYRQCMGNHHQVGLVACCHIDDYNNNRIRKHENTRKIKEDDRTKHLLSINANAGPVFLTYAGHPEIDRIIEDEMISRPMFHFIADDDVTHTGWRVINKEALLQAFCHIEIAYVADGHHRSASAAHAAKTLRDANPNHDGSEEYNWFLAVLFPASQLQILSYNRTVKDLHGNTPDELLKKLGELGHIVSVEDASPSSSGSCCLYMGKEQGGWYQFDFNPDLINVDDPIASLDVDLLQQHILSPILGISDPRSDTRIDFVGGIRGTAALEQRVDDGEVAIAFSLYPTTIDQLLAVADAQLIMPPKSTWFEPKLRSGLFVHELSNELRNEDG